MNHQDAKQLIRDRYSRFAEAHATASDGCCCIAGSSCSNEGEGGVYSAAELASVPETTRALSRGCGNPTSFAKLTPGEVVVDFGCGAGMDMILAARKVGPTGNVVGIDFSPSMIERAKCAIQEARPVSEIAFVLADLDQVPLPNDFADVITSNCVINLCCDKRLIYAEIYRLLKPGGRIAISDIIYESSVDADILSHLEKTWSGCVGGTITEDDQFGIIKAAGFENLTLVSRHRLKNEELDSMAACPGPEFTPVPDPEILGALQGKVASIKFTANKPDSAS